jgi:tetratricopeptide (TPR) repeat protein
VFGLETRARNLQYSSDEALWADTVAKQPANDRARVAYGTVLAERGRLAEAQAQFEAASGLDPADGVALTRLGSVEAAQGRFDEAIRHLRRALALRPDDVDAHRTLGQAYAMRGEDRLALPHLERALDAQRDDPGLLSRTAAMLAASPDPAVRDPAKAVRLAERAVTVTSRQDAFALYVLALSQGASGRDEEAAATGREALQRARAQGNQPLAAELERRLGSR